MAKHSLTVTQKTSLWQLKNTVEEHLIWKDAQLSWEKGGYKTVFQDLPIFAQKIHANSYTKW